MDSTFIYSALRLRYVDLVVSIEIAVVLLYLVVTQRLTFLPTMFLAIDEDR
jgi:hypothetical protein